MRQITYNATKTASHYHLDDSFVRLLLGPVGCGKSVANCLEIFRRGAQQEHSVDGLRYSRWAVCRSTYPELKSTTIKTWLDWFPEKVYGKIKYDSPICHLIKVADIHLEVLFLPLANDDDLSKLKSLELTGIYFNELQFFNELLFEESMERVNRYPPKKMGCKITWTGVIADTNPPDAQHWIYRRFEIQKPKNQVIFKYEPAVLKAESNADLTKHHAKSLDGTIYVPNQDADYVVNQQDKNYWMNLVESHNDDTIYVSYMGNYGIVRKNKRVYTEYNDKIHCVEKISYSPAIELVIGFDFGRTPTAVISQISNYGQLLILCEICSEDMGLDEFLGDIVIPKLNREYSGWKSKYLSIGDPAGIAKNPDNDDCCFDAFPRHGMYCQPALSNSFSRRREAVAFFMRKMVSGKPMFLINSECSILRQGFNGEYYYRRVQISHDERYQEKPEKNKYSHSQDCVQYIALHQRQYFDSNRDYEKDESYQPNVIY